MYFSSELTKNAPTELELLMEDFGTLVLSLPRIHIPNSTWRTLRGTGVWRLITVSPADTVSFHNS